MTLTEYLSMILSIPTKPDATEMVFSADNKSGPLCKMALLESAFDVEMALDLEIGPRLGTNPRSE